MTPAENGHRESIALDVAYQSGGVRAMIDDCANEFTLELESLAAESAEELRRVRDNAAADLARARGDAAGTSDAPVVSGEIG